MSVGGEGSRDESRVSEGAEKQPDRRGDDTALGGLSGLRKFVDRLYHQKADSGSLRELM